MLKYINQLTRYESFSGYLVFESREEFVEHQIETLQGLVDQLNDEELSDKTRLYKDIVHLASQYGFSASFFGEANVPLQNDKLIGILSLHLRDDEEQQCVALIQVDRHDDGPFFSLYLCGDLV